MEIQELKDKIYSLDLPKTLQIQDYATITNLEVFLESHFSYLENAKHLSAMKPYKDRLVLVYNLIKDRKQA